MNVVIIDNCRQSISNKTEKHHLTMSKTRNIICLTMM